MVVFAVLLATRKIELWLMQFYWRQSITFAIVKSSIEDGNSSNTNTVIHLPMYYKNIFF